MDAINAANYKYSGRVYTKACLSGILPFLKTWYGIWMNALRVAWNASLCHVNPTLVLSRGRPFVLGFPEVLSLTPNRAGWATARMPLGVKLWTIFLDVTVHALSNKLNGALHYINMIFSVTVVAFWMALLMNN